MYNYKELYKFFALSFQTLYIFNRVTLLMIFERLIVLSLLLFIILGFIFQGSVDVLVFYKLILALTLVHSYQGLSVIFDDYIKNNLVNFLFRSFIIFLSLSFFLS